MADKDKREAIRDVLRRMQRADHWCAQNADTYAALYARQTGVSADLARRLVQRQTPNLSAPNAAFVNSLQRAADRFHLDYGILPRHVDVAGLIASDLLG